MKFATKQLFDLTETERFKEIHNFHGISFELRDDPSELHICDDEGIGESITYKYPRAKSVKENVYYAKELVINADDENEATLVSSLVHIGCLLGYPSLHDFPEPKFVEQIENNKIDPNNTELLKTYFEDRYAKEPIRTNLYFGCYIASRSFGDRSLIYCLEKYKFSMNLSSLSPHSVHPYHGNLFDGYENDYRFHVSGAYAFLAAYSIIEDLGIDIRSNAKNTRFLKEVDPDTMNPIVKEDVMKRLAVKNIDGDELIELVIRGDDSGLTRKVKEKLGRTSKYNDFKDVYDIEMTIVEAIHYCSYIRSFNFAHGFSDENIYISPYDIHNVQMLVRRILLTYFGLWTGSRDKYKSE